MISILRLRQIDTTNKTIDNRQEAQHLNVSPSLGNQLPDSFHQHHPHQPPSHSSHWLHDSSRLHHLIFLLSFTPGSKRLSSTNHSHHWLTTNKQSLKCLYGLPDCFSGYCFLSLFSQTLQLNCKIQLLSSYVVCLSVVSDARVLWETCGFH